MIQTAKPVIPLPATASVVTWKLELSFFSQELSASRTVQSVSTNKHPTTLVLPAQMDAKPAQDRRWTNVRAARTQTEASLTTNTPTPQNATNPVPMVSSSHLIWIISVSTAVRVASLVLDSPSTAHLTEVVEMESFSTMILTNV